MSKRIKVADLPEFDTAHYLDSEPSICGLLYRILEANGAFCLHRRGRHSLRMWHYRDRAKQPDSAQDSMLPAGCALALERVL